LSPKKSHRSRTRIGTDLKNSTYIWAGSLTIHSFWDLSNPMTRPMAIASSSAMMDTSNVTPSARHINSRLCGITVQSGW
jgi:hypothetical protein